MWQLSYAPVGALDGNGPTHFPPHSVNVQGMQEDQDVYGAPNTPRASGDGPEHPLSATQVVCDGQNLVVSMKQLRKVSALR